MFHWLNVIQSNIVPTEGRYNTEIECKYFPILLHSRASPTLGCSIEISRDIYMSVYYYVCLSYVKLTA